MSEKNQRIVLFLLFLFILGVVAVPNAMRLVKLPLLLVIMAMVISSVRMLDKESMLLLVFGWTISIFYLAKGLQSTPDPSGIILQVFAVYLVAPAFWIVFACYLFNKVRLPTVVNIILFSGVIGTVLTFVCFWLYENGHYAIFAFIAGDVEENVNANFSDRALGIGLNSFGSLIFVTAGLFGLFLRNVTLPLLLIALLFIAGAIVSGRTALMLAVVIGIVFFVVVSLFANRSIGRWLIYPIWFFGGVLVLGALASIYSLDIRAVFNDAFEHIASGGGAIRKTQFNYLIDGINDTYMLGAGHGVGVTNVRLVKGRAWSYELLVIATLYRVGIIGLLVYAYPFIVSCVRFFKLVRTGLVSHYDCFFFFGFFATSVAVFTNPYLEAIEFQWAYFIPFIYFQLRMKSIARNRVRHQETNVSGRNPIRNRGQQIA